MARSTSKSNLSLMGLDKILGEQIRAYEGRHDDLIYLAPELCRLLDDLRFPSRLRPLVACAIAYFIPLPDIISEDLYGPDGDVDDIFLSAFVADVVRRGLNADAIVTENWGLRLSR